MAVVVMWDDGTEARWDSGSDWTQQGARLPYEIEDADGNAVATVPDFGVRYLALKSPDQITEVSRSDGMLLSRIRETD